MDTHFITVSVSIPADLAKILLARDCPHPVTLYPEQVRQALGVDAPDPRERFSELDTMLADLLDRGEPMTAGTLRTALDCEYEHIVSDESSIRRRFGRGMPLRDAGYRSTPRGYAAP